MRDERGLAFRMTPHTEVIVGRPILSNLEAAGRVILTGLMKVPKLLPGHSCPVIRYASSEVGHITPNAMTPSLASYGLFGRSSRTATLVAAFHPNPPRQPFDPLQTLALALR